MAAWESMRPSRFFRAAENKNEYHFLALGNKYKNRAVC